MAPLRLVLERWEDRTPPPIGPWDASVGTKLARTPAVTRDGRPIPGPSWSRRNLYEAHTWFVFDRYLIEGTVVDVRLGREAVDRPTRPGDHGYTAGRLGERLEALSGLSWRSGARVSRRARDVAVDLRQLSYLLAGLR